MTDSAIDPEDSLVLVDEDVQGFTASYHTNYPTSQTQPTDPPATGTTGGQGTAAGGRPVISTYVNVVPLHVLI